MSHALDIGAVEEHRALRSGRVSPYFFNSGSFDNGKDLDALISGYASILFQEFPRVEVVFGPAYKGIPLVGALVLAFWKDYGKEIGYAFDRKEEKGHGEKGKLVGRPIQGMRVVVVDDVMTTGGSVDQAVRVVRAAGGIVIGCMVAFDRQEREGDESGLSAIQAFSRRQGLPVRAAATLDDLVACLEHRPGDERSARMLAGIRQYRQQYGVSY